MPYIVIRYSKDLTILWSHNRTCDFNEILLWKDNILKWIDIPFLALHPKISLEIKKQAFRKYSLFIREPSIELCKVPAAYFTQENICFLLHQNFYLTLCELSEIGCGVYSFWMAPLKICNHGVEKCFIA